MKGRETRLEAAEREERRHCEALKEEEHFFKEMKQREERRDRETVKKKKITHYLLWEFV